MDQTVHKEEKKELNLIKNTVAHLEKMAETRTLTRSELNRRSEGLQKILEMEKIAVLDLKQISCVKWLVDGDENTKLSNGYIYNRNKSSIINGCW